MERWIDFLIKRVLEFAESYPLVAPDVCARFAERLRELNTVAPEHHNKYKQVVSNLLKDQPPNKPELIGEFILALATSTESLDEAYITFCRGHQLRDVKINSVPHLLGTARSYDDYCEDLTNPDYLQHYARVAGVDLTLPEGDVESFIDNLMRNNEDASWTDTNKLKRQLELLEPVPVPVNFFVQWSTFPLLNPNQCPFKEVSDYGYEIWNRLGLPLEEEESDNLLLFTFELSSDMIGFPEKTVHKPTVFEAEWKEQWRPNDHMQYGLTLPHSGVKEDGWPEVVHRPVTCLALQVPLRRARAHTSTT